MPDIDKKILSDESNLLVSGVSDILTAGYFDKAVEKINEFRKIQRMKRLKQFLETLELENSYLDELESSSDTQQVFLEYIESVISTPNSIACVAMALILKDLEIGKSLKSLSCQALMGISMGTVNVFIKLVEHVKAHKAEEAVKWIDNNGFVYASVSSIATGKEDMEVRAFSSDLLARSICAKGGAVLGDSGTSVVLNSFSLMMYKKLEHAKRIINEK